MEKTKSTKKPKSWKKMGHFNTYEAALHKKHAMQAAHADDDQLILKIHRSGPRGSRFTLKMWHPDFVTTNKKQVKSKKKK